MKANKNNILMVKGKKVIKILINVLFIIFLILVLDTYGLKSLWYMLGFFLVIALYRLWKSWEQIMVLIRYVETLVFGKPLDKDMWKKGDKPKWIQQNTQNKKD